VANPLGQGGHREGKARGAKGKGWGSWFSSSVSRSSPKVVQEEAQGEAVSERYYPSRGILQGVFKPGETEEVRRRPPPQAENRRGSILEIELGDLYG
jgi:hypothetical protein